MAGFGYPASRAEEWFGKELTVVIDYEYTEVREIWFPFRTGVELEEWWSGLEDIEDLFQGDYDWPDGNYVDPETEGFGEMWASGFNHHQCYKLWIDDGSNSCLISPDGRLVLHKGFPISHKQNLEKRFAYLLNQQ
jgi:hypothetical protein